MWPQFVDSYDATEEEHEGAPVYSDYHGNYLYRYGDGTWYSSKIGGDGWIKSVDTAQCPASNSQWRYLAPNGQAGDITVECN